MVQILTHNKNQQLHLRFAAYGKSPSSDDFRHIEEAAADSLTLDYAPDQPRDENGRWTSGGGNISEKPLTSERESGKIQSSPKPSATGANKFEKGFSKHNLNEHWGGTHDHSKQYPGWTKEQYAQRALELVQMPADGVKILGFLDRDGGIVRYDPISNDFVKGYIDGGIATMYKPKGSPEKGYEYFTRLQRKVRSSND